MQVALTIWEGRISPVFDVSRQLLLLDVEQGAVRQRREASLDLPSAEQRIERLQELGVDTLVCGAISEPVHLELLYRGLKVFGFVAGEVEVVIAALLAGALPGPSLAMPGCRSRKRRRLSRRTSPKGRSTG
jgi:predicted Fe-Mo cluster-binding NifX family protein